jgi:polysaccharide export outer membrane protein
MRSLLLGITAAFLVSSCGAVYHSPKVRSGTTASGIDVDVVPLTRSSVDFANRVAPYTPRPLPQALQVGNVPRSAKSSSVNSSVTLAAEQRRDFESRWPDPMPPQSYRLGVGDGLLFAPPSSAIAAREGLGQSGLDAAIAHRQTYTVQDDGSISIPDIGRIRVVGLTLTQVEQSIFQALLERQKDPSFSIEIADFNSQRVDVSGLVKQPASLPITLKPMYLREALSAVGGPDAKILNTEDVYVSLYRDGQSYQMLLSDVYSNPTLGRQILKDGDSITVDTLYSEARAEAALKEKVSLTQLANTQAQLASTKARMVATANQADVAAVRAQLEIGSLKQDYVCLIGEVKKQSRFALPFGTHASLADVMFHKDGGGFDLKTASVRHVYVLRLSDLSGRINAYHLNARNIAGIVVASDFVTRPDDFVFIAEQPITAWHRVIQQSVPSLFNTVNNIVGG